MPIGFLGTGAISAAMVTGLSTPGGCCPTIRLSPRNSTVAADLDRRFENVAVCASNQELLDTCDTVVLAVRPQVAEEVLAGLRFHPRHTIISVIAGYSARRLGELVQPAASLSRAVPLPSVAQRRSPIAVYPAKGPAVDLFSSLGYVVGVDSEEQLNAFGAATSTMAAYFGFVGQVASWLVEKGIGEEQARQYMARVFAGLADAGLEHANCTFEELAIAHATPGGLNERVLRDLTERGVFDRLNEALDGVYRRASTQSV